MIDRSCAWAIENLHLGIRRDAKQLWWRLESHWLVEPGFEVPHWLVHEDDRRTLGHAHYSAELGLKPNDIPSPQSERVWRNLPDYFELALIRVMAVAVPTGWRLLFHSPKSSIVEAMPSSSSPI